MLVFASLKTLIPKVDGTVTDNWVFRLHCRVTVLLLLAFTILATSREYIGNPIECSHDSVKPSQNMVNEYCWIQSTFSFPDFWEGEVGHDIIYPGVAPQRGISDKKVYHKYYQWVVFMLFLQMIMFYVPRYLWKVFEARKTEMLLQELNNPIIEKDDKDKKLGLLLAYFEDNRGVHNSYVYRYVFCEILNLVNVVGQIYMIDKFLGGEFYEYGLKVFEFINTDQPNRIDPMIKVFPRMTKCTFYYYGYSGDIQIKQALCVLPLNIINEKIYIFMWLWFCILTALTSLALLYRFIVLAVPCLRVLVVHLRSPIAKMNTITTVVAELVVGDWFILYQLSKNMDPTIFRDFLQMLSSKLREQIHDVENGKEKNHNGYQQLIAAYFAELFGSKK